VPANTQGVIYLHTSCEQQPFEIEYKLKASWLFSCQVRAVFVFEEVLGRKGEADRRGRTRIQFTV
jgi:hypothetical protein